MTKNTIKTNEEPVHKVFAKAELFDELIKGLQEIRDLATDNKFNTGVLMSNPPQNPVAFHVEHRADKLLSLAKGLQ